MTDGLWIVFRDTLEDEPAGNCRHYVFPSKNGAVGWYEMLLAYGFRAIVAELATCCPHTVIDLPGWDERPKTVRAYSTPPNTYTSTFITDKGLPHDWAYQHIVKTAQEAQQ